MLNRDRFILIKQSYASKLDICRYKWFKDIFHDLFYELVNDYNASKSRDSNYAVT